MGRKVDVDDLVGAAEIVEQLGRDKTWLVHDWRRRYPDFPAPVLRLRRGHVWQWAAVEAWARATGRLDQATDRRWAARCDDADLVGPGEIMERLSLPSREAVKSWRRRFPDFPQPVTTLTIGPVWVWSEIEEWARARGHPRG